ncbi:MAG: NAD-dependent epimerase/dehydratase family protein [Burkholderiales bacterium]|nr:MAG: NAD-dependent epimerase/dehydratase family protein [Burkholderiales bacterium]
MTHPGDKVSVLLAGATGLVGQQALQQLLADDQVGEVRALVRRDMTPAQLLGPRLSGLQGLDKLRICKANFDRLEAHADWFDVDWVFCALGTTIKTAGSQAAFRQVDFDYPLQIAQLAKAQGAQRFLLVSALGANARSKVFYSRVKGELEEAIRAIGFDHVSVARPSFLAGERVEHRLGEGIALKLGFLMPALYKPVRVEQVAKGLLTSARRGQPGWHVLDNIALRGMR